MRQLGYQFGIGQAKTIDELSDRSNLSKARVARAALQIGLKTLSEQHVGTPIHGVDLRDRVVLEDDKARSGK